MTADTGHSFAEGSAVGLARAAGFLTAVGIGGATRHADIGDAGGAFVTSRDGIDSRNVSGTGDTFIAVSIGAAGSASSHFALTLNFFDRINGSHIAHAGDVLGAIGISGAGGGVFVTACAHHFFNGSNRSNVATAGDAVTTISICTAGGCLDGTLTHDFFHRIHRRPTGIIVRSVIGPAGQPGVVTATAVSGGSTELLTFFEFGVAAFAFITLSV